MPSGHVVMETIAQGLDWEGKACRHYYDREQCSALRNKTETKKQRMSQINRGEKVNGERKKYSHSLNAAEHLSSASSQMCHKHY